MPGKPDKDEKKLEKVVDNMSNTSRHHHVIRSKTMINGHFVGPTWKTPCSDRALG